MAGIHFRCSLGHPLRNAQSLSSHIKHLSKMGVDLIVTPELAITGFPMEVDPVCWSETEIKRAIGEIELVARRTGCVVILGAPAFRAGRMTNALYWVSGSETRVVREKLCVSQAPEGHSLETFHDFGTAVEHLSYRGVEFGTVICCESLDHTIVDRVLAHRPHLVLHPSAWGAAKNERFFEYEVQQNRLRGALTAVVNQTGGHFGEYSHSESYVYRGQEILAAFKGDGSAAIIVDIRPGLDSSTQASVLNLD